MSDHISILVSQDHPCAKRFVQEGGRTVEVETGRPYQFDCAEKPVSGLADLAACLEELQENPQAVVIRGGHHADVPTKSIRRTKDNFSPAARQWCFIDIDDLPIPAEFTDWTNHLPDLVEVAVRRLPSEFQGVDCWYQFSSSMGIKTGKIRLHLWFWLSRRVPDEQMKAWLAVSPVDLRLYNPVQMHYVAKPIFSGGAVDPLPENRSGMHRAGNGLTTVPVPSDLEERSAAYITRPRHVRVGGVIEHQDIIRDPETGLAIDGRERLLFDLSNEVTAELVRAKGKDRPMVEEITDRLWERFQEEADLSRGSWTKAHAREKAEARVRELSNGSYTFTARGDSNTLLPAIGPYFDLKLVSAEEGKKRLSAALDRFFEAVSEGDTPRQVIKITMGAGKTTETIRHLKDFLTDKKDQLIEVYVPRHEIADEFEERLAADGGVNARVIHVFPRTGGAIDPTTGDTQFKLLCSRSNYVRELEKAGHSVFSSACQSSDGVVCEHFSSCDYLNQFRGPQFRSPNGNVIRIYQHTQLGLPRNSFEEEQHPDLVIVDEDFLSSLIETTKAVSLEALRKQLKAPDQPRLGDIVADALRDSQPVLEALRDNGVTWRDLNRIDLEELRPSVPFDPKSESPKTIPPSGEYHKLNTVKTILKRELLLADHEDLEGLACDSNKGDVRLCYAKDHRIPEDAPLLLLDATADQMLVEKILGPVRFEQIDIEQRAFVSQVYDHTGSNTWWRDNPDRMDELVQVLNAWVEYGETPLCVSHKGLADQLEAREDLDQRVLVMNFGGLRGSNEAEQCSVVFITGRNQPPLPEVDFKARAIFWDDAPLQHDDLTENLHQEVRGYVQSKGNPMGQSGVKVRSFSDPRIEAVHAQIREAETVQAIARLRLVHSKYTKRVFLLGNLPVAIPVDRLVAFDEMMPDKLEKELLDRGNLPLTAQGIVNFRPDLAESYDKARMMLNRSSVTDASSLAKVMPELAKGTVVVATFKAGDTRRREHSHLFLPKEFQAERGGLGDQHPEYVDVLGKLPDYSEIREFLEAGWGEIDDLRADFWYRRGSEGP